MSLCKIKQSFKRKKSKRRPRLNVDFEDNVCTNLTDTKGLKVAHLNVRSIINKIDEIRMLMSRNKLDVLTLSETWLDSSIDDFEINVHGYTIHRSDRNRNGGGVAIYVTNQLNHINISDQICSGKVETCWVDLILPHSKNIRVCSTYRPPNVGSEYFNHMVDEYEKAINNDIDAVILGDFNINYAYDDSLHNNPIHYVESLLSLTQLVTDFTRVTVDSSTIIDLILSSIPNRHKSTGVIKTTISDHYMVYTILNDKVEKRKPKTIRYRCFKSFDCNSFCSELAKDKRFEEVKNCTNVHHAWSLWSSTFNELSNKHAPIKQMRVKDRNNPWVSSDIIKMMYERDNVHKKAVKTGDPLLFDQYKVLRNNISTSLDKAKKQHYEDEITKNKNDSRKMWKTLKTIIPSKSSKSNKCDLTAQQLNEHFLNVGKNLSEKFGNDYDFTWKLPSSIHQFKLYEFEHDFVLKSLQKLPDKTSDDVLGINAKLLKASADFITDSLTHIYNLSLCTSEIPADWKRARVTPIYKGNGNFDDGNNFRPISVIAYVAKIMERGVQIQFLEYLMSHDFLSVDQSAYIKCHSTLTSLHKVIDEWYEAIDNDELTGVCFLDLSKCFDCIDHTLLLHKLKKYGVLDNEHKWFREYLTDRSQFVSLNGCNSEDSSVSVGVPQGSILGPFLFLIYVNDISFEVKNSSCNLYADDSIIYLSDNDSNVVQNKLQADLNNVFNWLKRNRLSINTKKSGVMSVHKGKKFVNNDDLSLYLDNDTLTNNEYVKYLGVQIDKSLSWSKHVQEVYNKLSPKVGLIRRLSKFLPKDTLICLYNTIVKPALEYCISVWGDCKVTDFIMLQRLQTRVARIICNNFDYNIAGITLVHELKWLTVSQLRDYQTAGMVFKSLNNQCPNYINDKFNKINDIRTSHTRNSTKHLVVPLVNKEYCKQGLSVKGPVLFNSLPDNVINAKSLNCFKKGFKKMCLS